MNFGLRHISYVPEYVYIHYPLCQHLCSYCDFNVYSVSKSPKNSNKIWLESLSHQLAHIFSDSFTLHPLKALYLGGGTPSLLTSLEVAEFMKIFKKYFVIDDFVEVTFEANPENLSVEYLKMLRRYGVNRLSIGVQTVVPHQLRRLERLATQSMIEENLPEVGKIFENYSLDFMLGIPDQTSTEKEREFIERLRPPHISVYLLTLSERSRMHQTPALVSRLASDETSAEFYLDICDFLRILGYEHYEVSNFSRAGFESRHNRNYWQSRSQYLGLGPGAHGYLQREDGQRFRYEMLRDPSLWSQDELGVSTIEELLPEQLRLEEFYFKLRTGISLPLWDEKRKVLDALQQEGLILFNSEGFRASERGWLVLEALAGALT